MFGDTAGLERGREGTHLDERCQMRDRSDRDYLHATIMLCGVKYSGKNVLKYHDIYRLSLRLQKDLTLGAILQSMM